MRIEFILGPAGSGKTRLCYDRIGEITARTCGKWLFLVPEQATYQVEKAILSRPGIEGYSGPGVVSFSRLAFLLGSGGRGGKTLGRISRQIVILKVLDELRGRLDLFDRVEQSPALADQLGGILREFQENEVRPDEIFRLGETLMQTAPGTAAGRKYRDLGILYEAYLGFLDSRFDNPDQWLTDAAGQVQQAQWLKSDHLWIDGFSGFTPQQLTLLIELIRHSEMTHLALCLDPERLGDVHNPQSDELSLFHTTEETYRRLLDIFRKNQFKIETPVLLEKTPRFAKTPALEYLERQLRRSPPGTETPQAAPPPTGGRIELAAASNLRTEVHFLVRRICRLVRTKGFRYSDIAVIVSDPKAYEDYLESALEDYGIPYFFDRPRLLGSHPVVEMLSAGLEAVTSGFETGHMLTWLKCEPVGPGREMCDTIETYAVATGIRGGEWVQPSPWTKQPQTREADLEAIDEARREAVAPLTELRERLYCAEGEIGADDFCRAVWRLLERMKVKEWLASRSEQTGDEHAQLYSLLIGLLDDISIVFGGDKVSAETMARLFLQGLGQLRLALIPPRLDQLLVSTIDRSRHPDLRAVFLLGVTQNSFPEPLAFDAILTDPERGLAREQGLEMSEGLMDRLTDREYLAYISLTRASEYLCLTRPVVDAEGAALMPASVTGRLMSLFADLTERHYHPAALPAEKMIRPFEVTDRLCDALGADQQLANKTSLHGSGRSELFQEAAKLAASLRESGKYRKLYDLVARGLKYDNTASLEAGLAHTAAAGRKSFSASQLRRFGACPYQHFAHDLLDLREREVFQLEPMDLGNFYHVFLEAFYRQMQARNLGWKDLEPEGIRKLAKNAFHQIEQRGILADMSGLSRMDLFMLTTAREICVDAVKDYAEMARAGSFEQAGAEVKFDQQTTQAGGLGCEIVTPAGRTIYLRGIIDRMDLARDGQRTFAAVFDYKLTGFGIDYSKIYHGLDLQGGIYLLAAEGAEHDGDKIDRACGFFLVPIEPGKRKKDGDFRRKARGVMDGECFHLFDGSGTASNYYNFYFTKKDAQYGRANFSAAASPEEFGAMLGHIRKKIGELADGIFAGQIDAAPYRLARVSPCPRCDYRSVCRFDWKVNPYRVLEKLPDKTTALERMTQEQAGNRPGGPRP